MRSPSGGRETGPGIAPERGGWKWPGHSCLRYMHTVFILIFFRSIQFGVNNEPVRIAGTLGTARYTQRVATEATATYALMEMGETRE